MGASVKLNWILLAAVLVGAPAAFAVGSLADAKRAEELASMKDYTAKLEAVLAKCSPRPGTRDAVLSLGGALVDQQKKYVELVAQGVKSQVMIDDMAKNFDAARLVIATCTSRP
jgi:hypothetical protein